jgi:hypothetical protein
VPSLSEFDNWSLGQDDIARWCNVRRAGEPQTLSLDLAPR